MTVILCKIPLDLSTRVSDVIMCREIPDPLISRTRKISEMEIRKMFNRGMITRMNYADLSVAKETEERDIYLYFPMRQF